MAFLKNNHMLYLGRMPNKIEVMQKASGLRFDEADSRRLETTLDGMPVRLISLAYLRANKLASDRHKALADLENLPEA